MLRELFDSMVSDGSGGRCGSSAAAAVLSEAAAADAADPHHGVVAGIDPGPASQRALPAAASVALAVLAVAAAGDAAGGAGPAGPANRSAAVGPGDPADRPQRVDDLAGAVGRGRERGVMAAPIGGEKKSKKKINIILKKKININSKNV